MAEPFRVRVATLNDADMVESVLRASYPNLMTPEYTAELLARAVPLMARGNPALLRCGTYYLAQGPEGAEVGCGGWTLERPGAAGEPRDRSLGCTPDPPTAPPDISGGGVTGRTGLKPRRAYPLCRRKQRPHSQVRKQ